MDQTAPSLKSRRGCAGLLYPVGGDATLPFPLPARPASNLAILGRAKRDKRGTTEPMQAHGRAIYEPCGICSQQSPHIITQRKTYDWKPGVTEGDGVVMDFGLYMRRPYLFDQRGVYQSSGTWERIRGIDARRRLPSLEWLMGGRITGRQNLLVITSVSTLLRRQIITHNRPTSGSWSPK